MTLPIFLSTFNRLELDRIIESYKRFPTLHEVIVIDNGSTDIVCAEEAIRLGDHFYAMPNVHYQTGDAPMDRVESNIDTAIRKHLPRGNQTIAVGEADVSFENTDPDALAALLEILDLHPDHWVGPHLSVGGIPHGYPLRSRVLTFEARLLFEDTMQWHNGIPYSSWAIDSHFMVYHGPPGFKRNPPRAFRVGPPYDALHLDWYVDIFNPTPAQLVFLDGDEGGSWGHAWLTGFWSLFKQDPELAVDDLEGSEEGHMCEIDDVCNNCFMLSWAYQYGIGCEPDRAVSEMFLNRAIPPKYDWFHHNKEPYIRMIYEDDMRVLGW